MGKKLIKKGKKGGDKDMDMDEGDMEEMKEKMGGMDKDAMKKRMAMMMEEKDMSEEDMKEFWMGIMKKMKGKKGHGHDDDEDDEDDEDDHHHKKGGEKGGEKGDKPEHGEKGEKPEMGEKGEKPTGREE